MLEEYSSLLDTPQWRMYRESVLDIFGRRCQKCGQSHPAVPLQVNHKRYIKGIKPWQYRNPDDIAVLCIHCHQDEHSHPIGADRYPTQGLRHISHFINRALAT